MTTITEQRGTLRTWGDTSAAMWVGSGVRLLLGIVLLVAGVLKVEHLDSSVQAVNAYRILPTGLASVAGQVLPLVEILIAALLFIGVRVRLAAASGAALMLAFTIAIAQVWARGYSIDCGCFGGGGDVAPGNANYLPEIARDLGLALCGLWLVVNPWTEFALEQRPLTAVREAFGEIDEVRDTR